MTDTDGFINWVTADVTIVLSNYGYLLLQVSVFDVCSTF